MSINVMLVDDQLLVRQGIESLLQLSENIEVVGVATNGEEALMMLPNLAVDVLLLDIRMPKMNGIAVLEALSKRDKMLPVLMLTTFDDHDSILNALRAGARGYMLKDVSLESLVAAIETLAAGGNLIQPALTDSLLRRLKSDHVPSDTLTEPVSVKEREILRLMAAGMSNQEIAEATHKSLGTVKNQVSGLLGKLGARDRTRAVLKAIEHGLLD
ncbi:response regulator [Alteromonas halophila]|uniref:DNA-binding response regulator n=1 Tax=Alteromonas halophila TaxID=516698 RepID=A0A918JD59_9ALTE|nr:response regulator transcription factor [Alteromonas halophila]GGW75278.1 DNA-binding response regulator [Alteromonas halophila]